MDQYCNKKSDIITIKSLRETIKVNLQPRTEFSYTLSHKILDVVFQLSSSYRYQCNSNHKNIVIRNVTRASERGSTEPANIMVADGKESILDPNH